MSTPENINGESLRWYGTLLGLDYFIPQSSNPGRTFSTTARARLSGIGIINRNESPKTKLTRLWHSNYAFTFGTNRGYLGPDTLLNVSGIQRGIICIRVRYAAVIGFTSIRPYTVNFIINNHTRPPRIIDTSIDGTEADLTRKMISEANKYLISPQLPTPRVRYITVGTPIPYGTAKQDLINPEIDQPEITFYSFESGAIPIYGLPQFYDDFELQPSKFDFIHIYAKTIPENNLTKDNINFTNKSVLKAMGNLGYYIRAYNESDHLNYERGFTLIRQEYRDMTGTKAYVHFILDTITSDVITMKLVGSTSSKYDYRDELLKFANAYFTRKRNEETDTPTTGDTITNITNIVNNQFDQDKYNYLIPPNTDIIPKLVNELKAETKYLIKIASIDYSTVDRARHVFEFGKNPFITPFLLEFGHDINEYIFFDLHIGLDGYNINPKHKPFTMYQIFGVGQQKHKIPLRTKTTKTLHYEGLETETRIRIQMDDNLEFLGIGRSIFFIETNYIHQDTDEHRIVSFFIVNNNDHYKLLAISFIDDRTVNKKILTMLRNFYIENDNLLLAKNNPDPPPIEEMQELPEEEAEEIELDNESIKLMLDKPQLIKQDLLNYKIIVGQPHYKYSTYERRIVFQETDSDGQPTVNFHYLDLDSPELTEVIENLSFLGLKNFAVYQEHYQGSNSLTQSNPTNFHLSADKDVPIDNAPDRIGKSFHEVLREHFLIDDTNIKHKFLFEGKYGFKRPIDVKQVG